MNNPEAFKEDEVLSIKFVVPGLPFGKQRPKVTVRKFTGSDGKEKKFAKAYTPEKTVNYENLVKMAYQEKAKEKGSRTVICWMFVLLLITISHRLPVRKEER